MVVILKTLVNSGMRALKTTSAATKAPFKLGRRSICVAATALTCSKRVNMPSQTGSGLLSRNTVTHVKAKSVYSTVSMSTVVEAVPQKLAVSGKQPNKNFSVATKVFNDKKISQEEMEIFKKNDSIKNQVRDIILSLSPNIPGEESIINKVYFSPSNAWEINGNGIDMPRLLQKLKFVGYFEDAILTYALYRVCKPGEAETYVERQGFSAIREATEVNKVLIDPEHENPMIALVSKELEANATEHRSSRVETARNRINEINEAYHKFMSELREDRYKNQTFGALPNGLVLRSQRNISHSPVEETPGIPAICWWF